MQRRFLAPKAYEMHVIATITVKDLGRTSFHLMAENWQFLKDTLYLLFFVSVGWIRNRVLLISDLCPNISLVVGQSSVNILLALRS